MPRAEGWIRAKGLKKAYLPGANGLTLLIAGLTRRLPAQAFWALRGVNLDVAPGEAVGLMGRNGSGKSSLLRLLAGASDPDEGQLELQGRIGSLLDLGAGLHPEFTGAANARLQGRLQGLEAAALPDYLERVRQFCGLGPAWELPCKGYSSGMTARLGFACAVTLDPQVLLVDEALAVGDAAFQKKCLDRIGGLLGNGTAVVLVSHQVETLSAFCKRSLVLEKGLTAYDGPLDGAVQAYKALLAGPDPSLSASL